jgi:hypothetical protein
MVALKGKSDIGDQINKKIVGPLADTNNVSDVPEFDDASKLGSGKNQVDKLCCDRGGDARLHDQVKQACGFGAITALPMTFMNGICRAAPVAKSALVFSGQPSLTSKASRSSIRTTSTST